LNVMPKVVEVLCDFPTKTTKYSSGIMCVLEVIPATPVRSEDL
jgi:hypothetical protein